MLTKNIWLPLKKGNRKKFHRCKVGNQKFWLPKGLAIEKIQSPYPMVTEKNLIVVPYGN
jgi:hypothetical protein